MGSPMTYFETVIVLLRQFSEGEKRNLLGIFDSLTKRIGGLIKGNFTSKCKALNDWWPKRKISSYIWFQESGKLTLHSYIVDIHETDSAIKMQTNLTVLSAWTAEINIQYKLNFTSSSNPNKLPMLTIKKTFCSQVTDAKPKHRQLIQLGDHILRERQQARQAVQLRVQAVPVSLGGIGFDSFSWGRLYTAAEKQTQRKHQLFSKMKANICCA